MSDQKQTKENETMNAAQVLVRCLENEGVEYVFGIPGEENLEVMRALKDSKIKFIRKDMYYTSLYCAISHAMSRAQLLWQMFTVN